MIRAALVGLGRIGALAPNAGGMAQSHLAAIRETPGLEIGALVDPDARARAAVRRAFPDLDPALFHRDLAALAGRRFDLVVLATPPGARRSFAAALALGPRLLFVEKPLAADLAAGRRLVAEAKRASAALRVNFHRRLDPGHRRMRGRFPGRPVAVLARYGKGLMNYGSHLVDLMLDWAGPISAVAATGRLPRGTDPSISFTARFASGAVAQVASLDGAAYDNFDADFFYADGRIELAAGGAERRVWRPAGDLHYPGYAHLAPDAGASETGPVGGLAEFYAAARDHLAAGAALPGCDGPAALAGLAVLDAVRRSAKAGGAWRAVPRPPARSRRAP
jgi:predicted dehydrogenase